MGPVSAVTDAVAAATAVVVRAEVQAAERRLTEGQFRLRQDLEKQTAHLATIVADELVALKQGTEQALQMAQESARDQFGGANAAAVEAERAARAENEARGRRYAELMLYGLPGDEDEDEDSACVGGFGDDDDEDLTQAAEFLFRSAENIRPDPLNQARQLQLSE